jgi:hypothetical protein
VHHRSNLLRRSGGRAAAIARVLCLTGILLATLAGVRAGAQPVAFNPQVHSHTQRGVLDWSTLFSANPAWAALASRIQVYLAPTGLVTDTPDDRLRAIAANLAQHHIAFELGLNSINADPGDPCGGREGYAPVRESQAEVEKLQRLGIRLDVLAMDGPFMIGHDSPDRPSCRLPIPDVVQRVARSLRPYLDAFPDLEIGDIEGVPGIMSYPNWQAEYRDFKQQLEAAIGRKIAFFRTDVNWSNAGSADSLRTIQAYVHGLGMRLSVIYDSDGEQPNSAAWVADAKQHFTYLESAGGVIPDEASIESWNAYPDYALPITANDTLGSVVAAYELPRTHFLANRTGNGVSGRLLDAAGRPVGGASVTVQVLGMDPTKPPPVRSVSGSVPAAAHFAILALRVNSECLCSGPNDVAFGDFTYTQAGTVAARDTYSFLPEARQSPAVRNDGVVLRVETIGGQAFTHIVVGPTQSFGFNSPQFAVTPGTHFTFSAPIGAVGDLGMFGSASVIWLTADGKGVSRSRMEVGASPAAVGIVRTNASGGFGLALPANLLGPGRPLRLYYPGSASLRAAYGTVP